MKPAAITRSLDPNLRTSLLVGSGYACRPTKSPSQIVRSQRGMTQGDCGDEEIAYVHARVKWQLGLRRTAFWNLAIPGSGEQLTRNSKDFVSRVRRWGNCCKIVGTTHVIALQRGPSAMTETTHDFDRFTLKIDRVLHASRATVWRCWTEVDLFRQWFCPVPWRVPEAQFDLRPGGRMNCVMAGPEGERVDNVGIWLEIVPLSRLIFTDAFSEDYMPQPKPFMTGFVELSETDENITHMVWGARHATEEAMRQHLEMGFEKGWRTAADQLEHLAQHIS